MQSYKIEKLQNIFGEDDNLNEEKEQQKKEHIKEPTFWKCILTKMQ